ncbi:stage II sporulation protein D [Paenibacillus sp. OAS669]|uniref:stage II sporulation protein D n=1 Tax=Paenibacillus sp. OAS669 TaxID=2663821 RepID=UPI001789CE4E|nr:stage II sporulation protein D [Paenibacillus sp. OAS669]MBE1447309.1 stage II sporulation protein D [Paenibacillus sp. OAS669]
MEEVETMDKRVMIQWAALSLTSFLAVIIIVPAILVKNVTPAPPAERQQDAAASQPVQQEGIASLVIPVYLSKNKQVESIPLEAYVRGVLAAEMPIEFELEAMKAQAMAARTYILRRIVEQDFSNMPVSNAWVTDTTAHQAYVSDDELKARWGAAYAANSDKLDQAVNETKDLILTYQQKPIQATFFSTSNGYTENSEDYWNEYIPYLRSVPSPWDTKLSPRYKETTTIPLKELQSKLGIRTSIPVSANGSGALKVLQMTEGHRIKSMAIGGKTFTGREVREKLGLASSQFQWSWKGTNLQVTTFGYGHGVGMSQWGANGMAMEGRKAEEIVKYFYTGIQISRASNLVKGKSF